MLRALYHFSLTNVLLLFVCDRALIGFILKCQNEEAGGIADRPGDEADVFHTFFGICGLSFLGYLDDANVTHVDVDPTFAMPIDVVQGLNLECQTYYKKN